MAHSCPKCHISYVCPICGELMVKAGKRRSMAKGEVTEKQQWHCDGCGKTTVNPSCKCDGKDTEARYWPERCDVCEESFTRCPHCKEKTLVRDGNQHWVTTDNVLHGRARWRCTICRKSTIKPICKCEVIKEEA